MVRTKRIYDPSDARDGYRYLVDAMWPRGMSKDEAKLTDWLKHLAPSRELRSWFGHDPGKWGKFRQRYRSELRKKSKDSALDRLAGEAEGKTVTLVYAARDEEHNNARALKDFIENRMHMSKRRYSA